jgi:hypothetical protein
VSDHVVHNHGPEEGPGLLCREIKLTNGQLLGSCLLPPDERLKKAYTLLCSAEPALVRGVQQAPNETSRHYQQLLLDEVRRWIAAYRDAKLPG